MGCCILCAVCCGDGMLRCCRSDGDKRDVVTLWRLLVGVKDCLVSSSE